LSQSFAKPCDILCDLVFDEGYVSSGAVEITSEGLVLYSQTGLGTCKYNGTGYTCNALLINHPSHHTIENIQADAEVLALFTNPTGKKLIVSSLIRVNPAQTNSTKFFTAFIPYASPTTPVQVKFGDDWELSMMVPPKATYYSYAGSMPLGGCEPAQVIVFSSMVNIDSNDFALLVKNVPAGSRPVQSLGDREVFFNSGEQLPGGQMPKDGKIYMRLRPKKDDGKKNDSNIKHPDIAGPQKREQDKAGFFGYISQWARDQTEINGVFSIINAVLLFVAFGLAVYCAYKYSEKLKFLLYFNDKSTETAVWLRQKVTGGVANYKAAKLASATSSSSASKPSQLLPSVSDITKKSDVPMEKAAEETSKKVVPKVLEPVDDITKSSLSDMSPSARKLDIASAAPIAPLKPVAKVVDAVGDAVTTNPVSEAVSDATEASEKKKGLKRLDSGLLPGNTVKSTLDRGQTSSRAMGFGSTGVNVDNLLKTASSSESKPFESHLGTKKAQAPVRARRSSQA
jgi:carbonic anhydrase